MTPRTLVLRTAGTNCDQETLFAFQQAGAQTTLLHVNRLTENPDLLHQHQILALPGGFSYGDDLAAGKILANELRTALADHLRKFVDDGKLIIGICNGFQVLVKTGLLPGPFTPATRQTVTLAFNDSNKFEDRWIHLRSDSSRTPFIQKGQIIQLPIAHGEGKFIPDSPATLDALRQNDQIVFRYVDSEGRTGQPYPVNPNGSADDIAGICDPTGRVLGLMPHPERHALSVQHPRWTREGLRAEGDGMQIFRNAVHCFT